MSSSCVITDIIIGMGHSGGLWLLWISDFNITAVLNFIATYPNMSVLCMGDMNNIMNAKEKLGPNLVNHARYNGPAYTWSNKRFSSIPTFERLDRCLVNAKWIESSPNTSVHHLPMLYSDHCPILIKIESSSEPDFQQVATESWYKSRRRDFNLKTTYLATDLKTWRRKKPNINQQLTTIENQLSILAQKDDEYHKQRAKKQWITLGDRDTRFFQKCILKRPRKNRIPFIITHDGHTLTTNEHMADYFKT
ncbi:hypothetical protein U9M48_003065 [Paspalum notatum var. saurae]|uniref:Endonuclease/exonuclease/phosphatase domain-containing protein n=1 Tax=Paspalum notatum var. saurae TaxID=547442 RepID=A0AAQ3SDU0_PASNO